MVYIETVKAALSYTRCKGSSLKQFSLIFNMICKQFPLLLGYTRYLRKELSLNEMNSIACYLAKVVKGTPIEIYQLDKGLVNYIGQI